jgi:hypothetical protein
LALTPLIHVVQFLLGERLLGSRRLSRKHLLEALWTAALSKNNSGLP